MKKILGTLLILTNIVIFSGCTFINEEEKFNPVALKIESTDLAQTTRDEYTIPAGGGQLTVYSAEEKNPFCLVNWFEVNGVECYLNGVENDLYNDRADYSYDWGEIIICHSTGQKQYYNSSESFREREENSHRTQLFQIRL